jgi:hypothetical protein
VIIGLPTNPKLAGHKGLIKVRPVGDNKLKFSLATLPRSSENAVKRMLLDSGGKVTGRHTLELGAGHLGQFQALFEHDFRTVKSIRQPFRDSPLPTR